MKYIALFASGLSNSQNEDETKRLEYSILQLAAGDEWMPTGRGSGRQGPPGSELVKFVLATTEGPPY